MGLMGVGGLAQAECTHTWVPAMLDLCSYSDTVNPLYFSSIFTPLLEFIKSGLPHAEAFELLQPLGLAQRCFHESVFNHGHRSLMMGIAQA